MALNRPGFAMNPDANAQLLAGDQRFIKFKEGETKMLRFLPPARPDGMVFVPATNHFGLVNQDGRTIALACLHEHGNDASGKECLLCAVQKYLKNQDMEDEFAKGLYPQTRFYTQVLEAQRVDGKVVGWSGPKLAPWSKTAAQGIQTIFSNDKEMGVPYSNDPDQGQALLIKRTGTGFATKYPVDRTGERVSLDVIRPTWAEEFIHDFDEAMGLNVAEPKLQAAYLRLTEPKRDWEAIFAAVGYVEE